MGKKKIHHINQLYSYKQNQTLRILFTNSIMKFKSLLSSAALILVVIVNAIFLGSAQARCISNNCGRYGGQRLLSSWEPTRRGYHLTRPSIFDHMSELFTFPSHLNSLLESQQRQLTNLYSSPSPQYHISENENSVDIAMVYQECVEVIFLLH